MGSRGDHLAILSHRRLHRLGVCAVQRHRLLPARAGRPGGELQLLELHRHDCDHHRDHRLDHHRLGIHQDLGRGPQASATRWRDMVARLSRQRSGRGTGNSVAQADLGLPGCAQAAGLPGHSLQPQRRWGGSLMLATRATYVFNIGWIVIMLVLAGGIALYTDWATNARDDSALTWENSCTVSDVLRAR